MEFLGGQMSAGGRFGKYGDLKRKELIRSGRIFRHGPGKTLVASAKAVREGRPGKTLKK
jgi:hypothetical protein